MNKRGFASDNNSGVSPSVIEMINEVNKGHTIGYGDDFYTLEAVNTFKYHFGVNAVPYFTFTGTAANVLSITASNKSFHSVLCASTSHIWVDECGAPEKFSGCKLIPIETSDGKLSPELLKNYMVGFEFEHHSQPNLISISQPTEMGTVYTTEELKELRNFANLHGLFIHMDGARLANAAVSLNLSFKSFTSDAGIDILSFGGTKNGLMAAESVIIFNNELNKYFKYIRKQAMQLASKMRFISAQFLAYFENELWRVNAMHANSMALKLFNKVKNIKGIKITQPVQANAVFAMIPRSITEKLKEKFFFYTWNEETNEVRWMTSFDTTEEDIDAFVDSILELMGQQYNYPLDIPSKKPGKIPG